MHFAAMVAGRRACACHPIRFPPPLPPSHAGVINPDLQLAPADVLGDAVKSLQSLQRMQRRWVVSEVRNTPRPPPADVHLPEVLRALNQLLHTIFDTYVNLATPGAWREKGR